MGLEALMFTGLFSWIILIVLLLLVFVGASIKKPIGVLLVPVCILIGLEYLVNGLGWHGLIMFFSSIFLTLFIARKGD